MKKNLNNKKSISFFILTLLGLLLGLGVWFVTSDDTGIWPIRNTVQYRLLSGWWSVVGQPETGASGALQGTARDFQGTPIAGAWVLASAWDGTTYAAYSNETGQYHIANIPASKYRPVAGAPGYQDIVLKQDGHSIQINAGNTTTADAVLPAEVPTMVTPGQNLTFTAPLTLSCTTPLTSTAVRREVSFDSGGQPNQPTFYYMPLTATLSSRLPVLLVIYPGPADTWQCASVPLAAAGYAVIAAGPAYTFDLENDIDELQRLVEFARKGQFPGAEGHTMAPLGGSYSSIHVLRLLQRDQNFTAAVLFGPPTDLFDMRRRLENGSYIPPFDLDKALIALGLPSQEPLRYWRYSGAYHVRPNFPPTIIFHSYSDDVVPYQQSELLVNNLELVGAPYEAHFFHGSGHYLFDQDSVQLYETTLDFLGKHLQ
jgi:dipeptidyl aminopeptidase/acylaminoacyl peptidase